MSNTYLPADVRTRIIDLMKERKVTQKKLALSIGVHESTLGRFLNGTTEKLSEESLNDLRLAVHVLRHSDAVAALGVSFQ